MKNYKFQISLLDDGKQVITTVLNHQYFEELSTYDINVIKEMMNAIIETYEMEQLNKQI